MFEATLTNNGQKMEVSIGMERISSTEILMAYYDGDADFVLRILKSGEVTWYDYDSQSGKYVENANANPGAVQSNAAHVIQMFGIFTDYDTTINEDIQYKKLETTSDANYGNIVVYQAFLNGTCVNFLYIQESTGLVLRIDNSAGQMCHYITQLSINNVKISDYIA